MDGDVAWDSTRWREVYREAPNLDPHQPANTPRELPDARRIVSLETDQQHQILPPWRAGSRTPIGHAKLEPMPSPTASRHLSDAWKDIPRLYGRQQTPVLGSMNGQHDAAHTSPAQIGGLGRGLPSDDFRRRTSVADRIADGSLSLQIPASNDASRTLPAYESLINDSRSSASGPTTSTVAHLAGHSRNHQLSLPSFASLQESAGRNDESDEGPEIAPMSDRLSCDLCSKLRPMIEDIAVAVAELDETVQTSCNRSVTRILDFPKDSPLRAVQWIVDRLRYAKTDLQEASRRLPSSEHHQQSSGTVSPPILKRPFQSIDNDDAFSLKRQKSGSISEVLFRPSSSVQPPDVQKAVYDFAQRENAHHGFSPEQTESHPNSAHPRQQSPSFQGPLRPPPSPSSIAYPPSVGASHTGHGLPSIGSPSTSYHRASSIHTVSTSSAASQHIADLQHQVTLKSLALQTLQSEYSSMLQKLQRERLKSQAIEKKTNVADQEVNDLTGRNEDLADQVKNLETSLEECEKRRENERAEMAKEKDQWTRMLDMGGRLHAKNVADRQKLLDEKRQLEMQISASGNNGSSKEQPTVSLSSSRNRSPKQQSASATGSTGLQTSMEHGYAVVAAQRENDVLKSRIDVLRFALDEMRRQTITMAEKEREVMQHRNKLDEAVRQALQDDDALLRPKQSAHVEDTHPMPAKSTSSAAPRLQQGAAAIPQSSRGNENASFTAVLPSVEDMARVGRAVSPGPAELGFEVKTTNATPDELIKALGPVPTKKQVPVPLPAWRPPHPPLKTNPASQHQKREPFGPSTPYPGTETAQWRPYERTSPPTHVDSLGSERRSASSSPDDHERSRRQESMVMQDSRTHGSGPQPARAVYNTGPTTSMPPPPRPIALGAQMASWRPS